MTPVPDLCKENSGRSIWSLFIYFQSQLLSELRNNFCHFLFAFIIWSSEFCLLIAMKNGFWKRAKLSALLRM